MRASLAAPVAFALLAFRPAHAQTGAESTPAAPSSPLVLATPGETAPTVPVAAPTSSPNGEPAPPAAPRPVAGPPTAATPPVAPSPRVATGSAQSPAESQPEPASRSNDAPGGSHSDAVDAPDPGAQLEDPRPTQGHLVALGLHGIGAMAFDGDRGTREPTLGMGVSLRLGESLTDWLSLSLAFALGSTGGEPRDSLTLGHFGISAQCRFTERWFVHSGLGAGYVQGPDPEDHDLSRGRYGDVYFAGVGRDFYLSNGQRSGGWVLTPLLTAEVGPDAKFTTTSLWLGIEVSWWTGLARDKLRLPNSEAYTR